MLYHVHSMIFFNKKFNLADEQKSITIVFRRTNNLLFFIHFHQLYKTALNLFFKYL